MCRYPDAKIARSKGILVLSYHDTAMKRYTVTQI